MGFTDLTRELYQTGYGLVERGFGAARSKIEDMGISEEVRSFGYNLANYMENAYPEEYGYVRGLIENPRGTLEEVYDEFKDDVLQILIDAPGYFNNKLIISSLNDPILLDLYDGDSGRLRGVYDEWSERNNIPGVLEHAVRRDKSDFAYSIGQIILRLLLTKREDAREILNGNPQLRGREPTSEYFRQMRERLPGISGGLIGPITDFLAELIEDPPKEAYRNEIRVINDKTGKLLDRTEKISDYAVLASNIIQPIANIDNLRNKGFLKYALGAISLPLWILGEGMDILPLYTYLSYKGLQKSFVNYATERLTMTDNEIREETEEIQEEMEPNHAENFLSNLYGLLQDRSLQEQAA